MKKTLWILVLLLAVPSFVAAQGIWTTGGNTTPASTASPAPKAAFSASVLNGRAPLATNFLNTSKNADSYLWHFGDGTTSNEASPAHSYSHPGTYSVSLTASSISGSNSITRNNYIKVAVNPNAPDLVPVGVWGSPSAQVGDTIDLTDTIENIGGIEADNFTVGIYLSQNPTVDTSKDPLLTYRIVTSLPPGGISSVRTPNYSIVPTIPSYIVPGLYYFAIVVDVANNIAELSKSNNAIVSTQQIEITGIPGNSNTKPDLTPVVIAPPHAWNSSGDDVSLTVENIGGAEATGFYIGFYASTTPTTPVDPSKDIFIGGKNFGALGAGAYESQIVGPIVTPSALSGGSYYIGAFVDPLNELSPVEASRANNTIKSTYQTTFP